MYENQNLRGKMLILTGPTGVGKTDFAIRLAREISFDIMSIDSMQIYKGFNIGTAKPTEEEKKGVEHHLMDCVEAGESFDVATFLKEAKEVFGQRAGRVLGVGGSAYYIQAMLEGLAVAPKRDAELEAFLSKMESDELSRWLKRLDSLRAEKIHVNDRFRLIRSLTIILRSGQKASSFLHRKKEQSFGAEIKLIGLRAPRDWMHKNLSKRIEVMFEKGLLEEAEALFKGGKIKTTASAAIGYKELVKFFEGKMSLDEAKYKILVQTRRLLKHQMTWLNKMKVTWVEVNPEESEKAYEDFRQIALAYYAEV